MYDSGDKGSTFTSVTTDNWDVKPFDARKYRPLNVKVSVTLHDIQAHLVKVSFF